MKKIFLYIILFVFLWSCGGSGDGNSFKSYEATADAEYVEEAVEEATEMDTPPLPEDRKIIKTGNIEFETNDLLATKKRIMRAITATKGYISSDQEVNDYYGKTENIMVIRVPVKKFDILFDSICQGVSVFDNKEVSAEDVTSEYMDAEARISSKKKIEQRYLELLSKAKNVEEMLQIERELGDLRVEIESIEGRLKYLKDRVSYSTLRVTFYKTEKIERKQESKVNRAFGRGWKGLQNFFLGLISIWPLLIVGAGVFVIIRKYRKKRKKK